jgi:hypothetical protein
MLLITGCANCDNVRQENTKLLKKLSLNEIAKEKFGSKFSVVKNESETYAICSKTYESYQASLVKKESFFIFDLLNNEIIFEDDIANSNVYWESDNLITVSRIPGMIKREGNEKNKLKIYSYNVLEKRKIIK